MLGSHGYIGIRAQLNRPFSLKIGLDILGNHFIKPDFSGHEAVHVGNQLVPESCFPRGLEIDLQALYAEYIQNRRQEHTQKQDA